MTRSDTGAAMTDGTVTSSVSVGGKAVAHLQTYTNGVAQVSYAIPAKTRGKILTVKLTVKTTTGAYDVEGLHLRRPLTDVVVPV